MKKPLLIFSLLYSAASFGQITVTEANVVVAGDQVIQNNDTVPSVASPTSGTNQTWDYSGLVLHTEDTMNFVAPGWLQNSSEFPSATLGATMSDGIEIYLEKDATGLRTLGIAADFFGGGNAVIVKTNPYESIIQFPANYNDAYVENYEQRFSVDGATVGLPIDSMVNKTTSEKSLTIDSWGSMTTPYGTFDVLGTYQVVTSTDSTWTYAFGMETLVDSGADTNYRRSYWSNDPGAKFPVLELELDQQGNVIYATWLKEAPTADIVTCFDDPELMIYPNPTSDFVVIQSDNELVSNVAVYDMTGAEVLSYNATSSNGRIDVRSLASGMYVVKAFAKDGSLLITEEIVKE